MTFACGTGRIMTTDTKSTETIVFGKLTIESSKPLINNKILIHFNERLWGKNAVWLDENGFFYTKLPLGNNFIALLEYRDKMGFYKNIPDNYVSINLPSSDTVYYIGDINFTWTPSKTDQRQSGGALGVVIEANEKGEKILVTVKETDSTRNYFKQKFPDNKKQILKKLATVYK